MRYKQVMDTAYLRQLENAAELEAEFHANLEANLAAEGYRVVMRVHDEIIVEKVQ